MDETESRTGLTKLSKGFELSLARMQALRETIPPDQRNHSPPAIAGASRRQLGQHQQRKTITREELARLLGPLETIYGSPQLGTKGYAVKYQIFFDVLRNCTELEVRAAVEMYLRRTNPAFEYFPKPAQLLALAKE